MRQWFHARRGKPRALSNLYLQLRAQCTSGFHSERSFPLSPTTSLRALEKKQAVKQIAPNPSPNKLTSFVTKLRAFRLSIFKNTGRWGEDTRRRVKTTHCCLYGKCFRKESHTDLLCRREAESKTAGKNHSGVKTSIKHRPQKLFCQRSQNLT